jgi:glutathione synthase/RimK-type ligase-like ATP-grasp enzyme
VKVLVLTRSSDKECTGRVVDALTARGHEALRFDTDLYPAEARLSTSYFQGKQRRLLQTNTFEADLNDLGAVYFRRFEAGTRLPAELGEFRRACYQESVQTFLGSVNSLNCFQLDPIGAIRAADYKELQHKRAIDLGLECPKTLFSNDPAAVAAFSAEVGDVVAKLQAKVVVHRQGEQQAVFTSLLGANDFSDMDGLRYSPMMFQEKIAKKMELRVTVVGNRLFPAAIDTTGSQAGEIDWRLDNDLSHGWVPWELPASVSDALLELVRRFGLNYSAADFILTPDDRYIFLEINAAGEWNWLARDMELPIADALVDTLTDPGRRL